MAKLLFAQALLKMYHKVKSTPQMVKNIYISFFTAIQTKILFGIATFPSNVNAALLG